MRIAQFVIGLILALTIHSLLNKFFPNALNFVDVYMILVVYYAMGGNILGTIAAAVLAGFVQDAYSNAIFGLHAFALTLIGYFVALVSSKIELRGPVLFGLTLLGAMIVNELIIFALANILLDQRIEIFGQSLLLKTLITSLLGALIYHGAKLLVNRSPMEAARRS